VPCSVHLLYVQSWPRPKVRDPPDSRLKIVLIGPGSEFPKTPQIHWRHKCSNQTIVRIKIARGHNFSRAFARLSAGEAFFSKSAKSQGLPALSVDAPRAIPRSRAGSTAGKDTIDPETLPQSAGFFRWFRGRLSLSDNRQNRQRYTAVFDKSENPPPSVLALVASPCLTVIALQPKSPVSVPLRAGGQTSGASAAVL
jgi:hypothetical protein